MARACTGLAVSLAVVVAFVYQVLQNSVRGQVMVRKGLRTPKIQNAILGQIFKDEYTPKGIIQKGYQRLSASKSPFTYYPLGLLLGLLPCGPVYASLIVAARAGMEATRSLQGVFTGASLMLAFGIGTVPALFIVGKLAGLRWLRSREVIYQIGAVLMVVVGVYFVIRGIRY